MSILTTRNPERNEKWIVNTKMYKKPLLKVHEGMSCNFSRRHDFYEALTLPEI